MSALSVSELTRAIRTTLEQDFDTVLVEGEISGLKHHGSGHLYFTLKDEGATLPAAMWKPQVGRLPAIPRDGDRVVVSGRLVGRGRIFPHYSVCPVSPQDIDLRDSSSRSVHCGHKFEC